jgi:hypothetical protein
VIYVHVRSTKHTETEDTMEDLMKEMRIHTLRGDLQSMGMASHRKAAMRRQLKSRYVAPEGGITEAEFEAALAEEYAKVAAWRAGRMG